MISIWVFDSCQLISAIHSKDEFLCMLTHHYLIVVMRSERSFFEQPMLMWVMYRAPFHILWETSQRNLCFCDVLSGDGDR
jgi:hypothetical protein